MTIPNVFVAFISALSMLWGVSSFASDGKLEINQACAVNSGCFPGDTAGFPITITNPGSYQLTGNLDTSSAPDTTAIFIDSIMVTLDLGGFAIQGPVTCTGQGGGLNCSGSTSGLGIVTTSTAEFFSLRNGTIRGMGGGGLSTSGNGAIVVEVKVIENNGIGMNIDRQSVLRDCIAIRNAGDGINVNTASVVERCTSVQNLENGYELVESVMKASVARGNGGTGVVGFLAAVVSDTISATNSGAGFVLEPRSRFVSNVSRNNAEPDTCGGGICTEKKRYYLTQNGTIRSDDAPGACSEGFHFASLYDIRDTTTLAYDSLLGLTQEDQGSGPPAIFKGWIRTGLPASLSQNCQGWTDTTSDGNGRQAEFVQPFSLNDPATISSPLKTYLEPCDGRGFVWCVED